MFNKEDREKLEFKLEGVLKRNGDFYDIINKFLNCKNLIELQEFWFNFSDKSFANKIVSDIHKLILNLQCFTEYIKIKYFTNGY